jgi:hypothetical protein
MALEANAASNIRTYPSSIDGFIAPDDATIAVRYRVSNDGLQEVSPTCTFDAYDSQNTALGKANVSTGKIASGATPPLVAKINIPTQAASLIKRVTVKCIATTTDIAKSTGQTVKVTTIGDCLGGTAYGAWDSDQKTWYWGSCAKASGLSPNTHLRCTENAVDSKGKVIASHTFNATTNNIGGVSSYGQNQDSTVNSTKNIALAIKSVLWTCTRN